MSHLSFVLLERAVEPDLGSIAEALRTRHPGLQVKPLADPSEPDANARSIMLEFGDQTIAIMMMPAPIPQDEGLWLRAATAWPEAAAVAAKHQAHVIVSPVGDSVGQLQDARIVTAVIGALIATTPECCAVVWGGDVAQPAELWLDVSAASFAPYPDGPFTLWFDVLPFRSGPMIGAITKGVFMFVGREIEFETGKLGLRDVMEKVVGLAGYLIENGPVVNDGDTFGEDESEYFQVRFRDSTRFPGLPVFFCKEPRIS